MLFCFITLYLRFDQAGEGLIVRKSAASMLSGRKPVQQTVGDVFALISMFVLGFAVLDMGRRPKYFMDTSEIYPRYLLTFFYIVINFVLDKDVYCYHVHIKYIQMTTIVLIMYS